MLRTRNDVAAQSKTGHIWPSAWHDVLLDAALAPDDEAISAFHEWCGVKFRAADLDTGTQRLLPMVYDRMRGLGVDAPVMKTLKDIYRNSWYKTKASFHVFAEAVGLLEDEGIDTLLLKGVPLAVDYYGNPALRPMSDLDVLVRPAQVREAIAVLTGAGWLPRSWSRVEQIEFRHSMPFANADGYELDLHWHVLLESCNEAADLYFLETAAPLFFENVATRKLSHGNALLHIVVHGIRWNRDPPIRWIPDALAILNHAPGEIDWQSIVTFAYQNRISYRLRLGLAYLARRYAAPVPEFVLDALTSHRVSLTERIENTVILRNYERMFAHPVGKLWLYFTEYYRLAHGKKGFATGFVKYLGHRLNVRDTRALLAALSRGVKHSFVR